MEHIMKEKTWSMMFKLDSNLINTYDFVMTPYEELRNVFEGVLDNYE